VVLESILVKLGSGGGGGGGGDVDKMGLFVGERWCSAARESVFKLFETWGCKI
jgi:hypothetical protein